MNTDTIARVTGAAEFSKKMSVPESDHSGHRARLCGRLITGGDAPLDHDLMEYLLTLGVSQRDTEALAKRLIAEFGGMAGLLAADPRSIAGVKDVETAWSRRLGSPKQSRSACYVLRATCYVPTSRRSRCSPTGGLIGHAPNGREHARAPPRDGLPLNMLNALRSGKTKISGFRPVCSQMQTVNKLPSAMPHCASSAAVLSLQHTSRRLRLALEEYQAPTEVKLAALWASTMFCYAYGDYFGLYVSGTLADMNRGIIGPLGQATSGVLIGVSMMMAIPSLMVALSLLLPAVICRWASVLLGIAYTAIMAVSLTGSEPFYKTFGIIEIVLTLAIAIVAFRWPRETGND